MSNHLPTEKKLTAISALAEGSSIRSVERMTGIHRDTIMRLGCRVGDSCATIMNERMRNLKCQNVEVDEIWGFIGKKQKRVTYFDDPDEIGDVWTFIALDADTKLIPTYVIGKRTYYYAYLLMQDLSRRMANRIQLSTDSMESYKFAVKYNFGNNVDYAQIVKTYRVTSLAKDAARRYSPADIVKVDKWPLYGAPDSRRICTSHVEKQTATRRTLQGRFCSVLDSLAAKRSSTAAVVCEERRGIMAIIGRP